MAFNFKKNFLIIMLLIIVLLSTIVYINIQNIKETFISNNRINTDNIIPESRDTSYNYFILNNAYKPYYIKNHNLTRSSLHYVKDVSAGSFNNNTNFFKDNKAQLAHYKNAATVELFTFRVNAPYELDLSSSITPTSSITSTSDISSIYVLMPELSGNLYDISTNSRLSSVTIKMNNVDVIKSGIFQERAAAATEAAATKSTPTATATAAANSTLGLNFSGLFGPGVNNMTGISNELFLYLLNNGAFGTAYVPPVYNNFETAMNLASNPVVNPVNSMNPLEYAQTLFGPDVTPMMSKNSSLNSDCKIAEAKDATTNKSNNSSSTKDMFKFDSTGNLLSQNIGGNSGNSGNSNSGNSGNSNSGNSNSGNSSTNSNSKCAPCPAPQRCPESNFECKKVPNYEQGIDNAFLPRPVLADFSTFGM
jgi:hypothetical protein